MKIGIVCDNYRLMYFTEKFINPSSKNGIDICRQVFIIKSLEKIRGFSREDTFVFVYRPYESVSNKELIESIKNLGYEVIDSSDLKPNPLFRFGIQIGKK